ARWKEYWCSLIFGKFITLNCMAGFYLGFGVKRTYTKRGVEFGQLHSDFIEVVLARINLMYLTTYFLQNGQLMLQLAIALAKLSGGAEGETVG
ncbi:hypothetical protein TrRE_jg1792, partial [Triparma retinervis]